MRAPRKGPFHRLGTSIVRHPWYPIIFWLLVLAVAVPGILRVSSVTDNSTTTLPSNAPSVLAAHEIARLFPNVTQGSSSLVVLSGPRITGPRGQGLVVNLTRDIQSNGSITDLASISTLYTAYQAYLDGQSELALRVMAPALTGPVSLYDEVNGTADLLWGVPAQYVGTWTSMVQQNPNTSPSSFNWPVYQDVFRSLGNNTVAQGVLHEFYYGNATLQNGFNGTADCAAAPSQVLTCAESVVRSVLPPWVATQPAVFPSVVEPDVVLETLGLGNFSSWTSLRSTALHVLSDVSGLGYVLEETVLQAFPTLNATPLEVENWAGLVADTTSPSTYLIPVPTSLWDSFVDPADNVTFLVLSFNVSDSYALPNGHQPVFSDLATIGALLQREVGGSSSGFSYWQTGEAASDLTETTVLNSSLAITLPITVLALLGVTIAYFRSPVAPLASFGAIGIALAISLGGIFVLGTLVGPVDTTSVTLVTTFVLGVGTDYGVFLIARYREELLRGRSSDDAIVTSVTWAGESIATSGATVILATLAMTFSGQALVSQWGETLSLSVLIALLLSLTVIPAILKLVGPRIFWPYSRDRFQRQAQRYRERMAAGTTYFQRAGRFSVSRPWVVVGVALLVSVPLIAVAIQAPVSYDFYNQLPSNAASSQGLRELSGNFGPGFAFPSDVLVTFQSPLLQGNTTNSSEFAEIQNLTTTMAGTPGVASVNSPVGPANFPLSAWVNYSRAPPALQVEMRGSLSSYVGVDGRTVWFTFRTASSGLSRSAVTALDSLESRVTSYAAHAPAIQSVAYGGAASEIRDLERQITSAQANMELIVVVGLLLVLLLVLGSLIVPPLALATIALSIVWAWALTFLTLQVLFHISIFFFVPTILFILVFGLGMDYNVFILTRIREERLKGYPSSEAVVRAVGATGGVITAAALILGTAFFVLTSGQFLLLRSIGFAVGIAVLLDAMFVRAYLVPASLSILKDRAWWIPPGLRRLRSAPTIPQNPGEEPGVPP